MPQLLYPAWGPQSLTRNWNQFETDLWLDLLTSLSYCLFFTQKKILLQNTLSI